MSEPRIAVVWMTSIPDVQNTTRYQRAVTLSNKYDADFFLTPGETPDRISSQATIKTQSRNGILGGFWFLLSTMYAIGFVNRDEYDAIHTSYHPASAFVGLVMSYVGIRWIHDIWDHPDLGITGNRRVSGLTAPLHMLIQTGLNKVAYSLLGAADLLVLALHPDIIEELGVNDTDILCIPNGTNISLYEGFEQREKDQFSIVYVGGVTEYRGTNTILQAVASVVDEIENLTLILVGNVHNEDQLSETIKNHNLNDIVEVTGRVSHQHALQYIADADVGLCLFPRSEQLEYIYPIKIFEYMALGTVPIASELTGIASIIEDGKNGFLVTPNDPDEAADVIREAYHSETESVIGAAQRDVKKYDWSNINDRFVNAIDDAIRR